MILSDNTDNIGDVFNFFRTTCIDNFYKNPDGVRNFALSLDYNDNSGNFPGLRTDNLINIDAQFYKQSLNKLLSLFFQVDITDLEKIDCYATTNFQKIYPYHSDKNNILNMCYIHTDNIFGGIAAVIYLYPNPSMDHLNLLIGGDSFYSKIEIINIFGNIVHSKKIKLDPVSRHFKLDISKLPVGNYILKIHSNSGFETIKFIKR